MILILLLIIIAVVFGLYMLGYIPGTDKYVLRVTNLKVLMDTDISDMKDIESICKVSNQLDYDEIEKLDHDKKYLTFTGMKTVPEIIDDDEKLKIVEYDEHCKEI